MNTQSKSSGPTTGYWVVLGLIVLVASAGGSLIGWLFLRPMVKVAGGVIGWDTLVLNADWVALLGGGLLVGGSVLRTNIEAYRRQRKRQISAQQLGFDYQAGELGSKLEDVIERLHGGAIRSVSNVMQRQFGETQLMVADMIVTHSDSEAGDKLNRETIALIADPTLRLPAVRMFPRSNVAEWLMKWLGADRQQRSLVDPLPEFERSYGVAGPSAVVQSWFDPTIQAYFAQHSGWQVHASGSHCLVWRPGCSRDKSEEAAFVDSALDVVRVWRERAKRFQAEALAGSDGQVSIPRAEHLRGPSIGMGPMVTTADLERVLMSAVPRRQLPSTFYRQKFGFPLVLLVGVLFSVGGAVFLSAASFDAIHVKDNQEWTLGILGGVFFTFGVLMFVGAARYRWYWNRILYHAKVAPAVIRHIMKTDTKINDQRRYLVDLTYEVDGRGRHAQVAAYGPVVERFEAAFAANSPRPDEYPGQTIETGTERAISLPVQHVLYDPRQPRRVVWAEGLIQVLD